ncbi:MAG TPA: hypothetical protein VK067_07925 [Pseudogracilibacillus sp.]|nr:hypothetical protein [Pseudogracilibacillus sp.]
MKRLFLITSIVMLVLTGCGMSSSTQQTLKYGEMKVPSIIIDLMRLEYADDDELIYFLEHDIFYTEDDSTYVRLENNGSAHVYLSEDSHHDMIRDINRALGMIEEDFEVEVRERSRIIYIDDVFDEEDMLELIMMYFLQAIVNGENLMKEMRAYIFKDEYDGEIIDKWRFPKDFDRYSEELSWIIDYY